MKRRRRKSLFNFLGNKPLRKRGNLYLISIVLVLFLLLVVAGPFFLTMKVEQEKISDDLKEHFDSSEATEILDGVNDNFAPWTDRAFIIVFVGYWALCLLLAYVAPEHPLLVLILVLLVVVFAAVSAYLANIWDDYASDPDLVAARDDFGKTDFILSNYPMAMILVGLSSSYVYYLGAIRKRREAGGI